MSSDLITIKNLQVMRKLVFISLFLLSLVGKPQAQTLATFEDGASDALFLCDYGGCGDPFWYDDSCFTPSGKPQIGANPSKSGINTSDKVVFCTMVANKDWWGGYFALKLNSPIMITNANRYLHLMVYRSTQSKTFRISVNDKDCQESSEVYQGKLANDATWENIVVDLGAKFLGQALDFFKIAPSCNWDDDKTCLAGTYAFDNFALSNSSLPPDINLLDGNNLHVGFENQAETDEWVKEIDMINPSNSYSIVDNPFTASAVNSGGKVLKFNKSADASWWQGCRFNFNGIMPVGGSSNPQYLHIMVYVPSSALDGRMGVDVQLCAKDHMGNENAELFTIWDDETDEWMDLVMEVNKIEYMKELTVRYDLRKSGEEHINSPANTYYLDDIVFNKSDEPREKINTAIQPINVSSLSRVSASNGIISVNANTKLVVQVYNVAGGLIQSVQCLNNAEIQVEKGVYIVHLTDGVNRQIVKALVK